MVPLALPERADLRPAHRSRREVRENRYGLRVAYAQLEQFADAEPLMVAAYDGFAKTQGQNSPTAENMIKGLIELYEKWGKPEKAAAYRKRSRTKKRP